MALYTVLQAHFAEAGTEIFTIQSSEIPLRFVWLQIQSGSLIYSCSEARDNFGREHCKVHLRRLLSNSQS